MLAWLTLEARASLSGLDGTPSGANVGQKFRSFYGCSCKLHLSGTTQCAASPVGDDRRDSVAVMLRALEWSWALGLSVCRFSDL